MDATTVYEVAKALPEEEQLRLYNMLNDDIKPKIKLRRKKRRKYTEQDAIKHLLEHHFNKKKQKSR